MLQNSIKIFLAIGVLLTSIVGFAQISSDGLIGSWSFSGNATDNSGSGLNGTVNGALLATDRFGNVNSAYSFDGVDDNISIPNNIDGSYTQMSVSAWVWVDEYPNSNYQKIFDVASTGGIGGRVQLASTYTNGFEFTISEDDISNHAVAHAPDINSVGEWIHLVGVWSSLDSIVLYINGVEAARNDILSGTGNFSIVSPSEFRIGSRFNDVEFFNGLIDDVRIYDRAITESEIQYLFNQDDMLIAYYPFNGNANDESGNSHNGTVNGPILTTDRFGNENSAYSFDGVDDEIRIPHAEDLNLPNDFTISAWFVSSDPPSTNNSHTLLAKRDDGLSCCSPLVPYDLVINYQQNGIDFGKPLFAAANESYSFSQAELVIEFDQWQQITLTYSDDTIRFHLNGLRIHKEYFESSKRGFNTSDLLLGSINRAYGDEYLKGKLDEIGIWNRALNQQEIANQFIRGICNQTITDTLTVVVYDTLITEVYDTITTQVYDTLTTEVYDTLITQIYDTLTTEVYDTLITQLYDTIVVEEYTYISVTDTLVINFIITSTGVPDINAEVKVYPNPATKFLTVETPFSNELEFYNFRIMDSQGQQIYSQLIDSGSFQVEIGSILSAGLYFIHIVDDSGESVAIKKLLIRN